MWGNKRSKTGRIETLIGQHSELKGDLHFSGGLHVDGVIKGNVIADSDSDSVIVVTEKGRIEGEVRVPHVILNGAVTGDVYAHERIELAAQARVTGNVVYSLIEMAMGAEVNGSLVHRAETQVKMTQVESSPAAPKAVGGTTSPLSDKFAGQDNS